MGKEVRWGKGRGDVLFGPFPRGTLSTIAHLTHLIVRAVFSWHGLSSSLTIQKEIQLFLCTCYQSNASSHQHTIPGHVVYKSLKTGVQGVRLSIMRWAVISIFQKKKILKSLTLRLTNLSESFLSFSLKQKQKGELHLHSKNQRAFHICVPVQRGNPLNCQVFVSGVIWGPQDSAVNWILEETWALTLPLTVLHP